MRFRLIPAEDQFYRDFLAMASTICDAAWLLDQMVSKDPPVRDKAAEIKEFEHRCDNLTHEIFQRLHRTYVTPIDREDIHALAKALDNVMDAIDEAAHLFLQYRIERTHDGTRQFTRIIVTATDQLRVALQHMEARTLDSSSVVEINRLENEADRLYQDVMSRLFLDEHDPITVIKWKDIFDHLEAAVDSVEDVSDVIQGVLLKHA